MKKIKILAVGLGLIVSQFAVGQKKGEDPDKGYNPLSIRPINESDVMFKTTLWRRLDMKEKQNQPLFSRNSEITKFLIEGAKTGLLDAYSNDSLTKKLTVDQFNERLQRKLEGVGLSKEEKEAGFSNTTNADDGWGGGSDTKKTDLNASSSTTTTTNDGGLTVEFFPNELNLIELKEDWVFDKRRSRQYFDIQSITILIPSEATTEGLEKPLASFKYKDLERYFRSNPKCIWYNTINQAQHRNLADAFELRLFHGKIVKQSNARDQYLEDIYKSPKAGMLKSQELEYELMEKEHNLWEY